MTMQYSTTDRNSFLAALVTGLGGNATMRFYSGTRQSPAAWTAGSPLAVLTFGSTAVTDANGGSAGGVASGVLTFGGYTQTSSGFTAGTPTWVALVTSGNRCAATIDLSATASAGNIQFSGSVVVGQNLVGTLALNGPNA